MFGKLCIFSLDFFYQVCYYHQKHINLLFILGEFEIMIKFLSRFFIADRTNYQDPQVRRSYGVLCGAVGIFLNILLFAGKWTAGFLSGSIAITADAFNNLSDAGSSVISLVGFKLSGQDPDREHPFGHGRMEYIAGLFVSVAILLMGFELLKSSVEKILHPEPVDSSVLTVTILIVSILVKLYMLFYNSRIGQKIDSGTMQATATDSLSDVVATSLVLAATIISHFTALNLDGWFGVLVGIFIFYTGITTMQDTINPLLGQPPKKELVDKIREIVTSDSSVFGIHDLIVHDYGPGRLMISLHAEVPATGNLVETHNEIDRIEQKLQQKLNCTATIHIDPVVTDNAEVQRLHMLAITAAQNVNPTLSIHDFRMVQGSSCSNVIFDLLIPYDLKSTNVEIVNSVKKEFHRLAGNSYHPIIQVDRGYC